MEKNSFPIAVRVSKTSLHKLPNNWKKPREYEAKREGIPVPHDN